MPGLDEKILPCRGVAWNMLWELKDVIIEMACNTQADSSGNAEVTPIDDTDLAFTSVVALVAKWQQENKSISDLIDQGVLNRLLMAVSQGTGPQQIAALHALSQMVPSLVLKLSESNCVPVPFTKQEESLRNGDKNREASDAFEALFHLVLVSKDDSSMIGVKCDVHEKLIKDNVINDVNGVAALLALEQKRELRKERAHNQEFNNFRKHLLSIFWYLSPMACQVIASRSASILSVSAVLDMLLAMVTWKDSPSQPDFGTVDSQQFSLSLRYNLHHRRAYVMKNLFWDALVTKPALKRCCKANLDQLFTEKTIKDEQVSKVVYESAGALCKLVQNKSDEKAKVYEHGDKKSSCWQVAVELTTQLLSETGVAEDDETKMAEELEQKYQRPLHGVQVLLQLAEDEDHITSYFSSEREEKRFAKCISVACLGEDTALRRFEDTILQVGQIYQSLQKDASSFYPSPENAPEIVTKIENQVISFLEMFVRHSTLIEPTLQFLMYNKDRTSTAREQALDHLQTRVDQLSEENDAAETCRMIKAGALRAMRQVLVSENDAIKKDEPGTRKEDIRDVQVQVLKMAIKIVKASDRQVREAILEDERLTIVGHPPPDKRPIGDSLSKGTAGVLQNPEFVKQILLRKVSSKPKGGMMNDEHPSLVALNLLGMLSVGIEGSGGVCCSQESVQQLVSLIDPDHSNCKGIAESDGASAAMLRQAMLTVDELASQAEKMFKETSSVKVRNAFTNAKVVDSVVRLRDFYTKRRFGKDLQDKERSMSILGHLAKAGDKKAKESKDKEEEQQKQENFIYGFGPGMFIQTQNGRKIEQVCLVGMYVLPCS
jgi:hypothetical protein